MGETGDRFRWPLAVISGLLVLGGELFFTGQAYRHWPGEFSPLTNFHSDLGRTIPGPRGTNTALGAQYYNAGQVFEGLALILFAGGLYLYYTRSRRRNALLVAGQLTGIFVGIGLIMNGVYSEDFEAHGAWVIPTFFAMTVTLVLVNFALYSYPGFPRWIAIYGFIVGLIPPVMVFVTTPMLESPYSVEYILLYGAPLWVLFVTADVFKREVLTKEADDEIPEAKQSSEKS